MAVIKTIPKEKKYRKAKLLSEEALQIAEKRRDAKGATQGQNNHRLSLGLAVGWFKFHEGGESTPYPLHRKSPPKP